jgi:plastocyanin/mono/diheme cytochrome c family protein
LGAAITVAGLIGLPIWVVAYNRSLDPSDRTVIHLTGVMKDGAWTTETVNSANYGVKTFEPAEIRLEKGERVLFKLTSADVTHGFYVPELGLGPVEVEPGHVEEINFDADTTGVFTYYCTTVCGDCHHFMRGVIRIGSVDQETDLFTLASAAACAHHASPPGNALSMVERGRSLFETKGCIACHNKSGRGGIRNPNYIRFTVPGLDSLAERMYLYEPEDVDTVLELLQEDADLTALESDPPFRRYNRFLAQYQSVTDVIRNGKPAGHRDTSLPAPPLNMPSWDSVLSRRDVDALIAYLLTEYPWEEDQIE